MLKGTKTTFKGLPSYMVAAGDSTVEMEEYINEIVMEKLYFQSVTQVSAMDVIKNPNLFKGLKRPLTVFLFLDESDLEAFVAHYEKEEKIKTFILSYLDWEQEKMFVQDQVISDQETDQISSMEELVSGVKNKNKTIGSIYGIDEEDPWDTRTEKEKAEDLLTGASYMQKFIDDGIFTDEAMAPSFEQDIEAKKMDLIDKDNIPEFMQEEFKKQGYDERDIERAIEEFNKQIEENNKMIDQGLDPNEERVKRITGMVDLEKGTGGIFINKDTLAGSRENKNTIGSEENKKKNSSMYEKLTETSMTTDDIKDILKPAAVDGKSLADFATYLFDNTTLDKYDYKESLEELPDTIFSEEIVNISEFPENIGKESDIHYNNDKENVYNGTATRLSEDEDAYIVKFDSEYVPENVIGSKGIKLYSVSGNILSFVPNDNGTDHIMIVMKSDDKIKIYKFKY